MMRRAAPLLAALLLSAAGLRAGWPATDSFGYQAAAVAQSWTDISGSGTAIPNAAFSGGPDDGSVQVTFPFNFSFYGSTFTKTYLRPNGYVQFSPPDSVFDPFTCPLNSLGQKGIVAGYWMDLDLTNSGVVYTQVMGSAPNRVMVIQYTDVPPHGGGAGTVTFQIQLGEDNSIVFSYNDTGTLGSGNVAVAGLSSFYDCPNRDSLTLSCDQANLVSGLCLRISYPALPPACGSPTFTTSPTVSPTITVSPTRSFTGSPTGSPTVSPTGSPTFTASPSYSDSPTPTNSDSPTPTFSDSPTATDSPTPTDSPSGTFTGSPTFTDSPTPTDSFTASPTVTDTWTLTDSPTDTGTFTDSPTDTPSFTASPTITDTFTGSPTSTDSPTCTDSPTDTFTASPSFSDSPTASYTASPTPTRTATRTQTFTASPTSTFTVSPTFTASPTITPTFTATATLFPAAPIPACLVLAQTNFSGSAAAVPPTAASLNGPAGIAWDTRATPYKVYIADSANHRVLLWTNAGALAMGQPADGVIGQADFASNSANRGGSATAGSLSDPLGLAVDPTNGDLWVADSANNRVLRYKAAQLAATGTAAAGVLGQGGSFFSTGANQGGLGAASLNGPTALSFDPFGRLAVADTGNHRVLRFGSPDSVASANAVWGQATFTANSPDHGGGVDNAGFSAPQGLLLAPTELWVADTGNHRVLHFTNNPAPSSTADLVLGQTSFTGNSANQGLGLPNQGTLSSPRGLAYDAANRLLVSDTGNNRVIGFEPPYPNAAAKVWGQLGNLGSAVAGTGQDRMVGPRAIAAAGGSLAVADGGNNRALFYGCGAAILVASPTLTATVSPTRTPSFTASPTRTPSFTASPSDTASPTFTVSPTYTWSLTPTLTFTLTPSLSATPTFTQTSSYTASPTPSFSPTASPTPTRTQTFTVIPSVTPYPLAYGKVLAWPNPIPRDAGGVNLGVPPQADAVSLDIYDRMAQPVAHLLLSPGQAGLGWVRWDLRNSQGVVVAPGLYLLRAQGKGQVWMGKVTVR